MEAEANTVDAIMLFLSVCTARTPFLDASCHMPIHVFENCFLRNSFENIKYIEFRYVCFWFLKTF